MMLTLTSGLFTLNAATVYDEAVSGDLSNSGLTPTAITLADGSNQILGTTGSANGLDRDYFSVEVPVGSTFTGILVLPGTTSGGLSFLGMQAGDQLTVPTNTSDASGLLGWKHYSASDVNTNILLSMAVPAAGSSGFTVPLGAGSYSFWIQDFNEGPFGYGFDLQLTPSTNPIPEPNTFLLGLLGLVPVLIGARRRWQA
jgi:hypothetical protein